MTVTAIDSRFRWPPLIAGLVLLCLCALGALARPAAFCAAWLIAWWLWASLALGAQANIWLHDLTGGAWGHAIRPELFQASRWVPPLCVLLIPLALAMPALYPWAQPGWAPSAAKPVFQTTWLSYGFVIGRLLLYALVLSLLVYLSDRQHHRRDGTIFGTAHAQNQAAKSANVRRKTTLLAAIGLLAWGIVVSLMGVDLIMSLTPEWYSSGFGFVVVTAQMKLGFAWAVMCTAAHTTPGVRRDLGNMLLMYVLMWAYLAYSQFEIIWAENLPDEIIWYVDRLQTEWLWLAIVLVVAGFFLPLFLLLFRSLKQDGTWLRRVAALICLMAIIEAFWLVLPSMKASGLTTMWMTACTITGMGLLLHGLPLWRLPRLMRSTGTGGDYGSL